MRKEEKNDVTETKIKRDMNSEKIKNKKVRAYRTYFLAFTARYNLKDIYFYKQ